MCFASKAHELHGRIEPWVHHLPPGQGPRMGVRNGHGSNEAGRKDTTRKGIVLALVFAGLLTLGPQAATAHDRDYQSSVTLGFGSFGPPNNQSTAWYGGVNSAADNCSYNRRVRVFERVAGPDEFIGGDATDGPADNFPRSYAVYEEGYPPPSGTYYAKALRKRLVMTNRHEHFCAPTLSPPLEVSTP